MREFGDWFSTFIDFIADYEYYCNFDKIYKNVESIKIQLNILNSLIGSQTIEQDFKNIVSQYPSVIECIPILLAVRAREIYTIDEDGEFNYKFDQMNYSIEQYQVFMAKTGLFELIKNHVISNLVDYATGVETGLDSNARKNRGGHLMEDIVQKYISKAGFVINDNFFKEMTISQITDKWGIDLSSISNNGKTEKRFDFVIKTSTQIYVIEANFYSSSGSKLNETARSYKQIAQEVESIDGVTFVWFTDGCGWKDAKHNLEETFDIMEHLYNINDMKNGIIKKITV